MDNLQASTTQEFKGTGAKDAFVNLLALITLVWLTVSFGFVVFQIINNFFPSLDTSVFRNHSTSGLKFNIASLIIITPIYLGMMGLLHKNYKLKKLNSQSGIYRWLTYLLLLATIIVIITSLIRLVFSFLEGEYAANTLFKIITMLLIALAVFGYYAVDLKRHDYGKRHAISQGAFVGVIILVLASVIGGVVIAPSPQEARLLEFDERRVEDLSILNNQIVDHYRQNESLPEDLNEPQFDQYRDPETGESYPYKIISETEYELCATFTLAVEKNPNVRPKIGPEGWYFHQAGQECFQQKISAQLLKNLRPILVE